MKRTHSNTASRNSWQVKPLISPINTNLCTFKRDVKKQIRVIRVIRGKLSRSRYIFLQEAGKKTLERTNLVPLSRRVGGACLYASPYRDAKKHSNGQT